MLDTPRHKGLRKKMIAGLQAEGIADQRVLEAMSKVPRHAFLDKAFAELAYENRAFTIGQGQTISHPYTVAYQSALLKTEPGMKVLEIGTGSGYQAAVLAELGVQLYTLERIKPLFEKTKPLLKQLGYAKIKCFHKDGFEGLPALGPYERIIITAAAPEIPKALMDQLAVCGIMIIPLGEGATQKMLRITKVGPQQFEQETLADFSFVPMLKGEIG
jgi:protein-L-isoaspartate(D-aspartate) O-methyltransferase